jgi:predicted Rossmann-fold nucleotide-binding protein
MFKTVLICGGREYANTRLVRETILDLQREGFDQVIEGGARGADTMAREAAQYFGMDVITYWANWEKYGKGAGPIRNQKMLDEGMPQLVVAFPGGRGTQNMVNAAIEAGVTVRVLQ